MTEVISITTNLYKGEGGYPISHSVFLHQSPFSVSFFPISEPAVAHLAFLTPTGLTNYPIMTQYLHRNNLACLLLPHLDSLN